MKSFQLKTSNKTFYFIDSPAERPKKCKALLNRKKTFFFFKKENEEIKSIDEFLAVQFHWAYLLT